jgi:hypothetical protein
VVEHSLRKRKVGGSIPLGGILFILFYQPATTVYHILPVHQDSFSSSASRHTIRDRWYKFQVEMFTYCIRHSYHRLWNGMCLQQLAYEMRPCDDSNAHILPAETLMIGPAQTWFNLRMCSNTLSFYGDVKREHLQQTRATKYGRLELCIAVPRLRIPYLLPRESWERITCNTYRGT